MATLPELLNYDAGRTIQFGEAGQKRRTLAELGGLAAQGDMRGAEAAAWRGGEPAYAAQLRSMSQQDKDRLMERAGRFALATNSEAEWEAARPQWRAEGYDLPPFAARDTMIKMTMPVLQQVQMQREDARHRESMGLQWAQENRLAQAASMPAEQAKPPSGYRWSADGTRLEAIEGGPATTISAEAGGRLAMLNMASDELPDAMKYFGLDPATGKAVEGAGVVKDVHGALPFGMGIGDGARARRAIRTAVEAALRAMTGAAAPENEVTRYTDMFTPAIGDGPETVEQKFRMLGGFINQYQDVSQRGRRPGGQQRQPVTINGYTIEQVD